MCKFGGVLATTINWHITLEKGDAGGMVKIIIIIYSNYITKPDSLERRTGLISCTTRLCGTKTDVVCYIGRHVSLVNGTVGKCI